MKRDIILAGVGGQGVLSIGAIIAWAALRENLRVKQSEVHGMSQRGGAVYAHLRLSPQPIHSDLIPHGEADMIVSMEPLESLRYVPYLSPTGTLITAADPVLNIADYPESQMLLHTIRELPFSTLVEAEALARRAGSGLARNMAMVGAASPHLPMDSAVLEEVIGEVFRPKGEKVVETNVAAFRLGREAAACATS